MRSKTFLAANMLATAYAVYLLWIFGGAVIEAGGADFFFAIGAYFELAFSLLGMHSPALSFLYVILVLLCVHILMFAIGGFVGWISYVRCNGKGAKAAAVLYLIGTLCFPLYLFFALPVTIVGFVGSSKQKKLNGAVPTTA